MFIFQNFRRVINNHATVAYVNILLREYFLAEISNQNKDSTYIVVSSIKHPCSIARALGLPVRERGLLVY